MYEKTLKSKASKQRFSRQCRNIALALLGLTIIVGGVFIVLPRHQEAKAASAGAGGDWPMYMHDVGRSSYNKAETIINRTSAPNLREHWASAPAGGAVFSQPIIA